MKTKKQKVVRNSSWGLGYIQGSKDERQFILNILDGIDGADRQMKNKGGGTKAIRLALKSRIISL